MTIPLFGFNPSQPRVQASDFPRRENFGTHFLATFGPAVENSAARFHQSQENELDRAFEMRAQEERLRAERGLQDDRQLHETTIKSRAGEIGPLATADNLELLREYTPAEQLPYAIGTTPEGETFIHKGHWDAVQAALIGDMETGIPMDAEDAEMPRRVLGEEYGPSDSLIGRVTDADGSGRITGNEQRAYAAHVGLAAELYKLRTENSRVSGLLRGDNKGEQANLEDFHEQKNLFMQMRLIHRQTGEEITGYEKAQIASIAADNVLGLGLYPNPIRELIDPETGMTDPNAVSGYLDVNFDWKKPLNAESLIESASDVLDLATTETGAVDFARYTAQGAFALGGGEYDRDYLESLTGTRDHGRESAQFASVFRGNPQVRKAFYLASQHENARQLEDFFADYGGYNEFRAFYDSGVIRQMGKIWPDRFGDFSIEAANTITSAPPGTGNSSPRADNPARQDTVSPRSAGEDGEGSVPPEVEDMDMFDFLGQGWAEHMESDPAFEREIEQFLLEVADPETGAERFIEELEEIANASLAAGKFTEEEHEMALAGIEGWRRRIDANRENFHRLIVPLLQDQLRISREEVARRLSQ